MRCARAGPFASKLAPTNSNPACRSVLARDDGIPDHVCAAPVPALSRASSLPQFKTQPVEARLPAMTVFRIAYALRLCPPFREQARSHKFKTQPVGARLPAMTVLRITYALRLCRPFREQARSHKFKTQPAGARLPDDGIADRVCAAPVPALSRASSLPQIKNPACRSALARDDGIPEHARGSISRCWACSPLAAHIEARQTSRYGLQGCNSG